MRAHWREVRPCLKHRDPLGSSVKTNRRLSVSAQISHSLQLSLCLGQLLDQEPFVFHFVAVGDQASD